MDRALSMLGFATKAGKTVSGEFSVETAIRNGKAKLVIVAEDASENTKKKFSDKCIYYDVPFLELGNKEQLGRMTGKGFRTSVAVLDSNFSSAVLKKLNEI